MKIVYTTFNNYIFKNETIDHIDLLQNIVKKFERMMSSLSKNDIDNNMFCWIQDDSFMFIPTYEVKDGNNITVRNNAGKEILKFSSINQVQRVAFYGICKYFYDGRYDENSFNQWKRFIWNIVSVNDFDKPDANKPYIRLIARMQESIKLIDLVDSHDAYKSLATLQKFDEGCNILHEQFNEEIEKAYQITNSTESKSQQLGALNISSKEQVKWEAEIIKQENLSVEKSVIRHLFTNRDGNINWSDFIAKSKVYHDIFVASDLIGSNNAEIIKRYISFFTEDQYLQWLHGDKRCFNNNQSTWRYFLLNKKLSIPTHMLLTNAPHKECSIRNSDNSMRLYQLSQTKLLDFVILKIPLSWIRWYHGHEAIFPSGPGVFLDAKARDAFLSQEKINVCEKHIVPDTDFYYESDIDFTYVWHEISYNFKWYRDNIVYLMTTDWEYLYRNENAENYDDKYYQINTQNNIDIIKDLETLIDKYLEDIARSHDYNDLSTEISHKQNI